MSTDQPLKKKTIGTGSHHTWSKGSENLNLPAPPGMKQRRKKKSLIPESSSSTSTAQFNQSLSLSRSLSSMFLAALIQVLILNFPSTFHEDFDQFFGFDFDERIILYVLQNLRVILESYHQVVNKGGSAYSTARSSIDQSQGDQNSCRVIAV